MITEVGAKHVEGPGAGALPVVVAVAVDGDGAGVGAVVGVEGGEASPARPHGLVARRGPAAVAVVKVMGAAAAALRRWSARARAGDGSSRRPSRGRTGTRRIRMMTTAVCVATPAA